MDKNQGFFDPYNFSMQQNVPHNAPMPQEMAPMMDNPINPAMYYEQQYMYYRYLTQLLEYKMKLKEWEKMNNGK
ncbi:MAG: hypothetical protein PHP54_05495 [Clostridia bacterium]|nr:hypothetical protein [Clostridia bacterium]